MTPNNESSAQNMYDLIAASFFQKKNCILPGIGQLVFTNLPAVTDFTNNQILAPKQTISFEPAAGENESTFNEFSAISELMKNQLETNGRVDITGVGSLTKQPNGELDFQPTNLDSVFLQPVQAVRIIRHDAEHSVLVGDREIKSTVMNEMLQVEEEIVVKKDLWLVWAIIGIATAAAAIGYYLYQYGFNNLANIR